MTKTLGELIYSFNGTISQNGQDLVVSSLTVEDVYALEGELGKRSCRVENTGSGEIVLKNIGYGDLVRNFF